MTELSLTHARNARGPLASLVVALVLRASPAAASDVVELRYDVAKDVPHCLSSPAFHDAVRERLPDHSFVAPKPITVITRIARDGERLRANVTLHEEGGSDATQEIFAASDECATLSAVAALAVSLAIQRSRSQHQAEAPAATATPERPPPTTKAPPPRSVPPVASQRPARRPSPRELRTHAVLLGGYGITPGASLGTSFGASMKVERWSAGLEAGAWLPTTVESDSSATGARAWLVYFGGSACVHLHGAFVCGVGIAGDFRAAGTGRLLSRSTDSTYVALGARVGAEIPVVHPLSLVIHGSVLAPLLRPALRVEDELLWRAPLVGGELGIGVRLSIL